MKKQLILVADMEGASGIFEENAAAVRHGSKLWYTEGRDYLTSDVAAVCEVAVECGIDEILLYDAHYAGNPEFNVILEKLPPCVKTFDTKNRRFDWRRIRGQAQVDPFGLITVGQHARYGEPHAYFPHTIQSPPIKNVFVNGLHIAEVGQAALSFNGTKYIANIGCHASHKEAREISQTVSCISVKNKKEGWEPPAAETYKIIKDGVGKAIKGIEQKGVIAMDGPCKFSMELTTGFFYEKPREFAWRGTFADTVAIWESANVEIGLELFGYVRSFIRRNNVKDSSIDRSLSGK